MVDIHIVCYTGGTCGDLVAGLIDAKDVSMKGTAISHSQERSRLKKSSQFSDDFEKDRYLQEIALEYQSIPSHDLQYHLRKAHKFISITVDSLDTARWAAKRFRDLHRPRVWENMMRFCGASTVDEYAQVVIDYSRMISHKTPQTISLEEILAGKALEILAALLQRELSPPAYDLYDCWLRAQCTYE